MRRLILILGLLFAPAVFAQQVQVQATITSPDGKVYAGATGTAVLVTPGNAQPMFGNQTVNRNPQPISGINGFGFFSIQLWNTNLLTPSPVFYRFNITDQTGKCSFQTGTIAITGPMDISTFISSYAAPLAPCQGGGGGGGGTPGGSNGEVQYNSSGTFGGAPGLITNGINLAISGTLGVTGLTTLSTLTTTGDILAGASVHIKGPVPWRDCSTFGYVGNGSTDDGPAINLCIAAAEADPGGTAYIPYTTAGGFINTCLVFAATHGNWLKVEIDAPLLQWGSGCPTQNIHSSFMEIEGLGAGNPTSFDNTTVKSTLRNYNAANTFIDLQGTSFIFKGLDIRCGNATGANICLNVDNNGSTGSGANVDILQTNVESSGSAPALQFTGLPNPGGFGAIIKDGVFASGAGCTYSMKIINWGSIRMDNNFFAGCNIELQYLHPSTAPAGQLYITNAFTEAGSGPVLTLDSDTTAGAGIYEVEINQSLQADGTGTLVTTKGTNVIEDVTISGSLGAAPDLVDQHLNPIIGLHISGSSPDASVYTNGGVGSAFSENTNWFWANNAASMAVGTLRGGIVACNPSFTPPTGTASLYAIDCTNGTSGVGYSSLTSPLLFWLDSGSTSFNSAITGATNFNYTESFTSPTKSMTFFVNTNPGGGLYGFFQWGINGKHLTFDDVNGLTVAQSVNALNGFQVNGAATNGHCLVGNGTNYVDGSCSGGGATTALNNLAAVAINTSLIPGAVNTVALGTAPLPFTSIFLGTVANQSTNIVPNSTANRTQNLQDVSDTFVYRASTDTLTHKTFDTAGTGNVFKINGTTMSSISGNTGLVMTGGAGGFVAGDCGEFDSSGNIVDSGSGCSGGATFGWSGLTAGTNSHTGSFISTGQTWDFTGAVIFKQRVSSGLTSSANGDLGYDTTNKNWHIWANAVDNFIGVVPVSVAPINGDCVAWKVTSSVVTLNDTGGGCGGTQPAFYVNTVLTSTQALLNITNSSLFHSLGVTVTNTSGGIVNLGLTGSFDLAGLTSASLGGDQVCSNGSLVWTECTPGVALNEQSGTSYTILSTDRGKLLQQSNSGATAYTLPAASSSGFGSNYYFRIRNDGAGLVTITTSTSTIQKVGLAAASTLTASIGETCNIQSDNTNYFADCSYLPLSGVTSSIGGSLLTIGTCSSGTVTITGATVGMTVTATPSTYPGDGNYWYGYVSSSNTVTVKVCAVATLTPTSSVYNVRVVQ
jgi:hypothetical protein